MMLIAILIALLAVSGAAFGTMARNRRGRWMLYWELFGESLDEDECG